MMDYCNRVQGFINFATSIPRNFTGGGIRYPCRKCQNKKYLYPDVKGFMENYLCWYAHGELFVRNKNMRERVVGSTSSASNVHEVANDNNNPCRNMVIDAMRMNQGNVSQYPIVEEEPKKKFTHMSQKKHRLSCSSASLIILCQVDLGCTNKFESIFELTVNFVCVQTEKR